MIALAAAFATLLIMISFSYFEWQQYLAVFERASETRRILTLNEMLLGTMRDAETGQRGFLLTGRPEYLKPFDDAASEIPAVFSDLEAIAAKNSEHRSRLL